MIARIAGGARDVPAVRNPRPMLDCLTEVTMRQTLRYILPALLLGGAALAPPPLGARPPLACGARPATGGDAGSASKDAAGPAAAAPADPALAGSANPAAGTVA